MPSQPRLAILLSTYNGGRFLAAQLESLFAQSYSNFILVVRDDGSSDDSLSILNRFVEQHAGAIHLVDNDGVNRGARDSFAYLLAYTLEHKSELGLDAAYMMFCDQDDVWYPHKIETQMTAMLAAEQSDTQRPLLLHSDLQVVSQQLEPMAESLAQYQGLETTRNGFNQMVISNLVTGCTALINEALARKSLPMSPHAIMHDWWLALVASAFGKVVFIDAPLVHYRQHGSNTIGAKEHQQAVASQAAFWRRVLHLRANEHLHEVAQQAEDFLQRFAGELTPQQCRGLRVSARMRSKIGLLQRLYYRRARRF